MPDDSSALATTKAVIPQKAAVLYGKNVFLHWRSQAGMWISESTHYQFGVEALPEEGHLS